MQVFLSVGRVTSTLQKEFLGRLDEKLATRDVQPKTIGRTTFTAAQPLDAIKGEMRKSRGLLVLAMERTRFRNGQEQTKLGQPPAAITDRRYATPWHQIELAMASMLGLPTLVLVEEGIFQEGLLEDKYGYYVFRTPLDPAVLDSDEFTGILDDWCKRVHAHQGPRVSFEGATIAEILGGLRPSAAWGALGALATLLASAFTLGNWAHAKGLVGEAKAATAEDSVRPPPPPPKTEPKPVADAFLNALESGDPHNSWEYLSAAGRAQVGNSEARWAELYRNNISPLGATTSRTLVGQSAPDSVPGLPAGIYRSFTYQSKHAKETGSRQENILMVATGDAWEVVYYQISPAAP